MRWREGEIEFDGIYDFLDFFGKISNIKLKYRGIKVLSAGPTVDH